MNVVGNGHIGHGEERYTLPEDMIAQLEGRQAAAVYSDLGRYVVHTVNGWEIPAATDKLQNSQAIALVRYQEDGTADHDR